MDLSVLIPARNEQYLQRTIDDVLAHAEADTEVIVVLDGCWPETPIPDNPRVVIIHHTEPRGQRASINEAARIARGKFICKLDAHCSVSQGFDKQLIADWQPGWTMVPTMYNLDVATWTPKLHKKTTAMFLTLNDKGELRAEYYSRQPKFDSPVHETMACMGPCWFLSAEDFWKQGGCDEGHGGTAGWGAQSVEVSCKAWLSGGALMTDENCYFAHHFRGDQGFPYPISGREVQRVREYSKSLWLGDKWPGQTRPFRWLVEKFAPPGWEGHTWEEHELASPRDEELRQGLSRAMFHEIHAKSREPHWRGTRVVKQPSDMILYHEVIYKHRPRWIVETGTRFGGSAKFFADQLEFLTREDGLERHVVTIDLRANIPDRDPRVIYLTGSSRDPKILQQVETLTNGEPTMVTLDSDHSRSHVKWELVLYAPLVSPDQYLVVEDCYRMSIDLSGPGEAVEWFLGHHRLGKYFEKQPLERRFIVGVTTGGWLYKKPV